MLKATATLNGRRVLIVGLSFKNLDKFRAEPGDTFIKIDGAAMGLPIDVIISFGETEAMGKLPNTIVHVDEKLKS